MKHCIYLYVWWNISMYPILLSLSLLSNHYAKFGCYLHACLYTFATCFYFNDYLWVAKFKKYFQALLI